LFFQPFKFNYSTTNESNKNQNSKGITLFNKSLGISCLVKKSKITNVERNLLELTPKLESILIGLLLSDGWFQKRGH